jgi:hypothetical protein
VPFKSKAQRRKFAALLVQGKISPDTFEEWNRETGRKALPERVGKPRAKLATQTRKPAVRRARKGRGTKRPSAQRARRQKRMLEMAGASV